MNPSHSTGLHARIWRKSFAKNRLTSARSSLGGVGALLGCMAPFFGLALITTDKQG
jgi:hypothetical protein